MIPPAGGAIASLLAGQVDTDRLRDGKGADGRRAAAVALEVTFFTQLLASMRKTVPDAGLLPRSPTRTTYEGMFDRSIAETLAADDPLGLVERLAPGGGES